jgi:hypothetical protein
VPRSMPIFMLVPAYVSERERCYVQGLLFRGKVLVG